LVLELLHFREYFHQISVDKAYSLRQNLQAVASIGPTLTQFTNRLEYQQN